MKIHLPHFAALLPLLFAACNSILYTEEDRMRNNINNFASAYFNWQYKEALPFCTPESERWLRFAASNVTQEDVDLLRAQQEGASHKIDSINYDKGDTTATAYITVKNFLQADSIDTPAHMVKRARICIPLVLRNKKWLVKMEVPLQSEK